MNGGGVSVGIGACGREVMMRGQEPGLQIGILLVLRQ